MIKIEKSSDGITTKYTVDADQNDYVQVVHVNRPEKHIICFPTGIGCPVGCRFCRAAAWKRSLSYAEMYRICDIVSGMAVKDGRPVLFSAMGEGEPLLSDTSAFALFFTFATLMNNVPNSKFAVSTSCPNPKVVRKFSDVLTIPVKLQISVHATTDEQRERLMPRAGSLLESIDAGSYFAVNHNDRVEWNYTLIAGENDSDADAQRLASLIPERFPIKLNRFNPIPGEDFRPSTRVDDFVAVLEMRGRTVERYATDGSDIAAACGQLTSNL